MAEEIRIRKKPIRRGDVRMTEELIGRLDDISGKTNRTRNEIINMLLEAAVDIVKIEED